MFISLSLIRLVNDRFLSFFSFAVEYVHQHAKLFLNNSSNRSSNEASALFSDSKFAFSTREREYLNKNSHLDLVRQTWWGSRRVDYIVYCPEFLMTQPAHVLPIVFHSSYWESRDVMSFILRNVIILFD